MNLVQPLVQVRRWIIRNFSEQKILKYENDHLADEPADQ